MNRPLQPPDHGRRVDHTLRKLVVIGNHLALWAGRTPVTPEDHAELSELHQAWDRMLHELRTRRKEIEHVSL